MRPTQREEFVLDNFNVNTETIPLPVAAVALAPVTAVPALTVAADTIPVTVPIALAISTATGITRVTKAVLAPVVATVQSAPATEKATPAAPTVRAPIVIYNEKTTFFSNFKFTLIEVFIALIKSYTDSIFSTKLNGYLNHK